jgi:hypothetical protein
MVRKDKRKRMGGATPYEYKETALNSAKHPPTPFLFSIGAMRNLGKIRRWVVPSGGLAALGPIGVYAYIIGFAIPMTWDIPLMVLAVTSILAAMCSDRVGLVANQPLPVILLALFLLATGLSLLVSDDIGRSLRLSASLLPALLLSLLITEYFQNTKDIRLLYLACSTVSLGLAIALLWAAWKNPGVHPHAIPHPWVSYVGSPIWLGKEVILLSPPPRRTGRASHPAPGSSNLRTPRGASLEARKIRCLRFLTIR